MPTSAHEPAPAPPAGGWHQALAAAVRDPATLHAAVRLPPPAPGVAAAARAFPVRVTPEVLARIRAGDAGDPVLAQFLPTAAELEPAPGFGPDPVGDLAARCGPGLLRKYRGRLLVMPTTACAVHCRYCFRRHYPHREGADPQALAQALAADPTIGEVILSGGDPLMLPDRRLRPLLTSAEAAPGVRRLRIHTRIPTVLPERVDDGLCALLSALRVAVVVVLHVNHAAEIGTGAEAAVSALRAAGVTVLNQAVLLRGVNDDEDVLAALSERLFDLGVLPYYLHQLDPVAGAAHFAVDDRRALAIEAGLRARLPGYLVPRLVREVPGAPAKLALRDAAG